MSIYPIQDHFKKPLAPAAFKQITVNRLLKCLKIVLAINYQANTYNKNHDLETSEGAQSRFFDRHHVSIITNNLDRIKNQVEKLKKTGRTIDNDQQILIALVSYGASVCIHKLGLRNSNVHWLVKGSLYREFSNTLEVQSAPRLYKKIYFLQNQLRLKKQANLIFKIIFPLIQAE